MKKSNDKVREELEGLSPLLAKMKKEPDGFKAPDHYFERLTEAVMEQVRYEPAVQTPAKAAWYEPLVSAIRRLPRPRYAMGLAGIAILIAVALRWLNPPAATPAWSEISTEAMTEYVERNIQEFELDLLVELAPDLERRSILSGTDLEEEALNGYLEEMLDEVEMEDLEEIF